MKLFELLVAAAFALSSAPVSAQEKTPDLLIVGSPHLANPNKDMVKSSVPDIMSPNRQREIEALVDALARYRPTRIAVEVQVKDQARLNQRYAAYRSGSAQLAPTELEQIGFRLAARLNLPRLEAVDWNGAPPMAEADYDFAAWADTNGRGPELKALLGRGQTSMTALQARWRCTSVGDWYRQLNAPSYRAADNKLYFDIAMFGEAGPNWVGGSWFMRNLRIFSQLRRSSEPNDRMLVLFGASHAFPIEQYAQQSGTFTISDTLAYLPKQSSNQC